MGSSPCVSSSVLQRFCPPHFLFSNTVSHRILTCLSFFLFCFCVSFLLFFSSFFLFSLDHESVFLRLPSSLARPRDNFHIAMGHMGATENNEYQSSGLTQQQHIHNIDSGIAKTMTWISDPHPMNRRGPVPNLLANLDRFSTLRLL